jgi:hypothetical protein
VINKWPHIEYHLSHTKPGMTKAGMSRAVACQCINARGAIAHGRKIECSPYAEDLGAIKCKTTVENAFNAVGGAKKIHGVDEIKREVMMNGPIVSISFRPSEIFLSSNSIGSSDHCHQGDILIVGWKQLSTGEVWITQPLFHAGGRLSQVAYVAMFQFGIDECCLAPTRDLENDSWQSGPHYDLPFSTNDQWRTMTRIRLNVPNLEVLFKTIGTTSFMNIGGPIVTLRNIRKNAHSRKARLDSVKWNEDKKKFTADFTFIE